MPDFYASGVEENALTVVKGGTYMINAREGAGPKRRAAEQATAPVLSVTCGGQASAGEHIFAK